MVSLRLGLKNNVYNCFSLVERNVINMRHFVLHFVFDYVLFTKSENSRYAGSIFFDVFECRLFLAG